MLGQGGDMRGTEIMVTVEGRSSLCGLEGGWKRSEREEVLREGDAQETERASL